MRTGLTTIFASMLALGVCVWVGEARADGGDELSVTGGVESEDLAHLNGGGLTVATATSSVTGTQQNNERQRDVVHCRRSLNQIKRLEYEADILAANPCELSLVLAFDLRRDIDRVWRKPRHRYSWNCLAGEQQRHEFLDSAKRES